MESVSVGAVNGARAAHDLHAQSAQDQQLQSTKNVVRQYSVQSPEDVKPVRKSTGESSNVSHPLHERIQQTTRTNGVSRNGSKHDGPRDLVKKVYSNGDASDSDGDIPENMYRPDKDHPEGWIHRDKLAKIESEELQAAGINLADARSRSRDRLRELKEAPRGIDNHNEGQRDGSHQPINSSVKQETSNIDDVERSGWDLRTQEEIAADQTTTQLYANPVFRRSGSKIPVLTSSPHPIPQERLERDTPIARKRTASGSISLESDLLTTKTRSSIIKIFDEGESGFPSSSPATSPVLGTQSSSPTKMKSSSPATTRKVTPSSRKASIPPNGTPNSTARPSTRSGEPDRPRTAVNRPEGDPPWLATMYKPDPMLPPDQQLIPTLAKKQLQEKWAENGAIPKTYDREFYPLAVHDSDGARKSGSPSPERSSPSNGQYTESNPDPQSWPLKSMNNMRNQNGNDANSGNINTNSRPGTSGSITTGGYSTMPKVSSPAVRESSPKIGAMSPHISSSTKPAQPTRMHQQTFPNDDREDDGKVKKGCGCCIVM